MMGDSSKDEQRSPHRGRLLLYGEQIPGVLQGELLKHRKEVSPNFCMRAHSTSIYLVRTIAALLRFYIGACIHSWEGLLLTAHPLFNGSWIGLVGAIVCPGISI